MKSASHIPELDGVRGIAILMVVVFHAFVFNPITGWVSNLASYGFTGVDLFFVLSGFLITGILLNAKGQTGYFRNFYVKRALRIWPLYYLLLLLSFGLLPLLILRSHLYMEQLPLLHSRKIFVYILMFQNVLYAKKSGIPMLVPTWSLAIEEQFYLVWPWLILWCSRKKLASILVAVLALSPLVRLWAGLHGVSHEEMDYLTWFRLDGICLGALIALYSTSAFYSLRRAKWAAVTALAIGAAGTVLTLHSSPLVLGALSYSMFALASAGVVTFAIWCCQTNSPFGRPFRARWLRYLGVISYCLYLVHHPIYYYLHSAFITRHVGDGAGAAAFLMVLGFVLSLGIAGMSWRLFESPILALKNKLVVPDRALVLEPTMDSGFSTSPQG